MLATGILLSIIASLVITGPASAGEVVLYTRDTCESFPTIFAASVTTTDCRQAETSIGSANFYGVSTSRNTGPSCTFTFYTDANCKTTAGKVVSSGPFKNCLSVTKGILSYKVTCKAAVAGALTRPRTESDLVINTYAQPQAPFRGSPSGHHDFSGYNDFCGMTITTKPTGKPSSAGPKLAAALFNNVPTGTHQYAFSASDGGTLYKITLSGATQTNQTAASAARYMGQAAFASLMADTVAQLAGRPCDYLYYGLADEDDNYLGGINASFVAP